MVTDLAGTVFGRLTVIARGPNYQRKYATWICRCECGVTKTYRGSRLRRGDARSCGCGRVETAKANFTKHGKSGARVYNVWQLMIRRCTQPKVKNFHRYGGRGIAVCERWMKFENFLADMGEPPINTSLDRIDNNGNYEPNNCRWADRQTQSANSTRPRLFSFNGRTMNLSAWAKELGIHQATLSERLIRGWPVELALSVRKTHRSRSPRQITRLSKH